MRRIVIILLSALLSIAVQAQEYVPTPVTVSKEKVKLNGKVYYSHVVLERQTIYGIAKAYGVTEDDLFEANPSLRETGLQKNAIILVPHKDKPAVQEVATPVTQEEKDYTEHIVKWYEDIEDIARKYNISVKQLMDYNGLKVRKLASRQVLRIPLERVPETPEQTAAPVILSGSEESEGIPSEAEEAPVAVAAAPVILSGSEESKESVEFSLVLPIKAATTVSAINMDFYCGALMAVKDLEADGIKIRMNVFDLAAGMPSIETLVRGDFVLGPVASRDMEAVLQRVDGKVPVISPLDPKTASLDQYYTNFVQAPTSAESQWEDLAAWVGEDLTEKDKIVFVTEKGASNVAASVALRTALAKRDTPYEILSYVIVEGTSIPEILEGMLTQEGQNRIMVASESEAFVGDVVRNIGIMQGKGYEVVMYAPSKVRSFETIDGSDYHSARLHISTSYYVDYSDPRVDAFVKAYRALYNTEPSQFAFQGYDTARYFMERATKGIRKSNGLHTDFSLEYNEKANAVNKAVRRIIYNKDYTTTLVR